MRDSVSESQIKTFYGNIKSIRKYPFESEIRQIAIKAYSKTNVHRYAIALGLPVIQLIAACLQSNYFLSDSQNTVNGRSSDSKQEIMAEKEPTLAKTWKDKLVDLYSKPLFG